MPSKTPQQARLMRAACHNADVAKKAHIPQKVACEFVAADKKKASHQAQHDRYAGKGKPAQEGVSVHTSAAVSSTGYVQPNGSPPFKVF